MVATEYRRREKRRPLFHEQHEQQHPVNQFHPRHSNQLGCQNPKRNLPMKLLFFLVGFYCATAFSTVIGQTGDWDILSAAFAVLVVEGIGALTYKASLNLVNRARSLITMFNYWKAGFSLGLFLDSFKYDIGETINGSYSFLNFEVNLFPPFL